MTGYKVLGYIRFKQGMEEEGKKFIENELIKTLKQYGCYHMEFLQSLHEPLEYIGSGLWKSLKDIQAFEAHYATLEKQLMKYCDKAPIRMVYRIDYAESMKDKKEGVRTIVHYYLKKGMESEGKRYIQNEIFKKCREMGCDEMMLLQDEKDPSCYVGIGTWKSLQAADKMKEDWSTTLKQQLMKYCTKVSDRKYYKIINRFSDSLRKAA